MKNAKKVSVCDTRGVPRNGNRGVRLGPQATGFVSLLRGAQKSLGLARIRGMKNQRRKHYSYS